IHPRSTKVSGNYIMPSSFIGLPMIYGFISKFTGIWTIPYMTPIFAIIGIIFFFLLIKEIFDKKTAIISSLLLLVLPSYWYFSVKSMMHNILFIVLFIISTYYFLLAIKYKKILFYLIFPIFLALSLMTRTSEIVWISFIYLIITIFSIKKIDWKKFILSGIIFLIFLTPLFYFNKQNQGSVTTPAYLNDSTDSNNLSALQLVEKIILPFGFHPKNMQYTIWNYIFKLVWFYSLLFLVGIIYFIWKRNNIDKIKNLYFLLWILLSGFLFTYYGSWLFYDNPTPTSVTIGSSYLRYLLPYFVFGIPIAGFFISKINFKKTYINTIIISLILIFIFINSYMIVMKDNEEGIIKIGNDLNIYKNRTEKIIQDTPKNAIIITNMADKYIFPYRNVIHFENEIYLYNNFDKLFENNIPLYYFGFTFKDLYINSKFENENIKISEPIFTDGDHSLYKIYRE
ncbi:MAG: glycosyltransferase family 39 protein, partial [Patescibacteria group bacterium]|nr:glycosyltransferase family 39 protein [Patescibacteria group bacterium]